MIQNLLNVADNVFKKLLSIWQSIILVMVLDLGCGGSIHKYICIASIVVLLRVFVGCKKYVSVWGRLREAFEAVPLPQGLSLVASPSLDAADGDSGRLQHARPSGNAAAAGDEHSSTAAAPAIGPQRQSAVYPSAHEVAKALSNPQAHQRALSAAATAQTTESAPTVDAPSPALIPDSSDC